jgi:serine/threonine protein kinase
MINTTIGKYKIIRLIGEGGMASVYEAEHEMLGTKVAIKVLNPILSANDEIKERFRNEAKLMASLNHPNITKVIDFDEQPQQLSIVMEFLSGEDLNDVIKKNGALSEKEIINCFSQSLSAFQYAHEKGIVHRDIKPSNIFILPNGQVKILDFGIAKLFGTGNDMTQTGTQMGTPIYMSPEQVKADKSIDHRSDIYSLGVTMFYAINGKPPYDGNTTSQFDIFNKIVYDPLPEIGRNSYLNDLVKKACNKDRNQRFQYCQEWIDALNNKEATPIHTADKTVVEVPASNKTIAVAALTPTSDKTNVETTAPATILNEIIPSKLIIGRLFYLSLFGCLNWAWFIFMIVVHHTDHRWDLYIGSNEFITFDAGMWTFICGLIVLIIEVIFMRNKITKKLSIFSLIITSLLLGWNFLMITSNGRIDFREVSIAWVFYGLIIASLNIYQLINLYKAKSVIKT